MDFICIDNLVNATTISMKNTNGITILSDIVTSPKMYLQLTKIPPGIYFVCIQFNDGTVVDKKIIVE